MKGKHSALKKNDTVGQETKQHNYNVKILWHLSRSKHPNIDNLPNRIILQHDREQRTKVNFSE